MSKLKDMISSVTSGSSNLSPKEISNSIKKRFDENISEKDISDFLQSEFYPDEEISQIVKRHTSFDGRFYY